MKKLIFLTLFFLVSFLATTTVEARTETQDPDSIRAEMLELTTVNDTLVSATHFIIIDQVLLNSTNPGTTVFLTVGSNTYILKSGDSFTKGAGEMEVPFIVPRSTTVIVRTNIGEAVLFYRRKLPTEALERF